MPSSAPSPNCSAARSARIGCGTSSRNSTGWGSAPPRSTTRSRVSRKPLAYLAHPLLGPRLQQCAEAVLRIEGRSATAIFGSPDDWKLRSCATLFALVSPPGSVFDRLLDTYYRGERDAKTLQLLGVAERAGSGPAAGAIRSGGAGAAGSSSRHVSYGPLLPHILLNRGGYQQPIPPGARGPAALRGPVDRGGADPQAVGDGAGRIAADLQGEIGDAPRPPPCGYTRHTPERAPHGPPPRPRSAPGTRRGRRGGPGRTRRRTAREWWPCPARAGPPGQGGRCGRSRGTGPTRGDRGRPSPGAGSGGGSARVRGGTAPLPPRWTCSGSGRGAPPAYADG